MSNDMTRRFLLILVMVFVLTIAGVVIWQKVQDLQAMGELIVNVAGGNANIYLNNQPLGAAPIKSYRVTAGFYQVSITTDNYTFTTPIRVSPHTATVIDWQLQPTVETSSGLIYELIALADRKQGAQLSIKSIPDRAIVTVSGQENRYFAPFVLENLDTIAPQIKFELAGYKALTAAPTLTDGYQLVITAKLAQEANAN